MPIDWLVLFGAFASGLLGTVHCVAMCGGIATNFSQGKQDSAWMAALPNLGRVLGYALGGAIVGGFGGGLLALVRDPAIAQATRAAVGLVLVVAGLRLLDRKGRLPKFGGGTGARLWRWLAPLRARVWPADTAPKRLALGMLWGWMPCGLSSTLLAAAWLQASAWHGALTMAAFGIGTLPVMIPLTWAGMRIGRHLQRGSLRVATGGLVIAAGLLTVAGPWLMRVPVLHGVLEALGCRSLPG